MDTLTGRPKLLKQANLCLIRKAIRAKGTASRSEIAIETDISSTTVRSLLIEMLQNGEIEQIGYDESTGGRKAQRYRLRNDRYYGVAFCIIEKNVYCMVVDICGRIIDNTKLEIIDDNLEKTLCLCLEGMIQQRDIKSVGLGVPGAVEGESYWVNDTPGCDMRRIDIGGVLYRKYGIPVILENDLNATAIGYERCYERMHPDRDTEETNMVYLHFGKRCVSAGIVAGGKIIRGYNNFAGELGFIPMEDGSPLAKYMCRPLNDTEFVAYTSQIIVWICGILNPRYIVLSGSEVRRECIGAISDRVSYVLPRHMIAEILYSQEVLHDYFIGMASLTAGKMFDEVQFIKGRL